MKAKKVYSRSGVGAWGYHYSDKAYKVQQGFLEIYRVRMSGSPVRFICWLNGWSIEPAKAFKLIRGKSI